MPRFGVYSGDTVEDRLTRSRYVTRIEPRSVTGSGEPLSAGRGLGLACGQGIPHVGQSGVAWAIAEATFIGGPTEIRRAPSLMRTASAGPELAFHVRHGRLTEIAMGIDAHDLHDAGQAHIQQSAEQRRAGVIVLTSIAADSPGEGDHGEKSSRENTPGHRCLDQVSPPVDSRNHSYIRLNRQENSI